MKNKWLQVETSLNVFAVFRLRYLSFDFSTVYLNTIHSVHIIRTGRDSYIMVCSLVCSNYPGMGRRFFPYGKISVEYSFIYPTG
jgi:hypothetical protein